MKKYYEKNIEDLKLIRVNVSIEEDCKNFYQFKAKSLGMSMSSLMAFILSDYYESQFMQEEQEKDSNV